MTLLHTSRERSEEWVVRLPRCEVVDRLELITREARNKRVVHVGFADAGCPGNQETSGLWLHDRLAAVAKSLVGIDLDAPAVRRAQQRGYAALLADCEDADAVRALDAQPAELLVAGEILEHLESPGRFLDVLHLLLDRSGRLLLTTPNSFSLRSSIAALRGYEVAHPDHVASYSFKVLVELLRRHEWVCDEVFTYLLPPGPAQQRTLRPTRIGVRALQRAQPILARWRAPFLADGLILICSPRR
jgi:hypothetical protein